MNFVGLFIILLFLCTPAMAQECLNYFSAPKVQIIPKNKIEIIERGFVKTTQGKVYLKIEKPNGEVKGWLFLLHGLLDSHRGWNDLVPYFLGSGYGVVRMDLVGHGKTFFNQYKDTLFSSVDFKAPYKISYKENVQITQEVLLYLNQTLGIKNPTLIGHSMGGAVALESVREFSELISQRVILIAPYVYRLEKRVLEKTFSSYFWGFDSSFFNVVPDFYREFLERWLTDFFSDSVLYDHYRKFAEEKILEENSHMDKEQIKKMIRYHIRSGLATTKGLRDFNGIETAQQITKNDFLGKFLVLIGSKDELLDVALEKKLSRSLPNGKLSVIPKGTHMMINEQAEVLAQQIIEFLDF